ncbi:MAG: hypothetical protein A2283_00825 [Lentisphaerae bacterium RIFOXYA12_FULL_48_11]|nr:MAG: hypothetical protein A2283_00825 [Lentisphaerae bacterium RIFOXYA12_FULL_48_11]
MNRFMAVLIILTMAGCGDSGKESSLPPAHPKTSAAKDAIDGLTGKTAVMAGEQAKTQIRTISAEQNKKLNEVLDDK